MISPENSHVLFKRDHFKRKHVCQASCFRGYVRFRGSLFLVSAGNSLLAVSTFALVFWLVVSNLIFYFHPKPWGFMIQFDVRIFFSDGLLKNHQLHPQSLTLKMTVFQVRDPGSPEFPGGHVQVNQPLNFRCFFVFFGGGRWSIWFI